MQADLLTWQAAPTIAGPCPTSADGTLPSRDYAAIERRKRKAVGP